MILQALNSYYDRKLAEEDMALAPFGFEQKELPFLLEIDASGHLVQIVDTRESRGKKKLARSFLVPKGEKKTSGVAANLLWDNAEYVLGIDTKGKPDRVRKQAEAFRERIQLIPPDAKNDTGIPAVLEFLTDLNIDEITGLPAWEDLQKNPNLGFRLQGDNSLVSARPAVVAALQADLEKSSEDEKSARCLVTGDQRPVARLHTAIKGVWGAQTSGANIVSFNLDAFDSYGKSRGENAPVGIRPAFAYTTALNYLLRKDSPQRLQVGDTSTVFWADKHIDLETGIVDIFGEPPKDDPDRNTNAVKALYKAVEFGRYQGSQGKTRFFVLGLAPNAARISIRFWENATVSEISERICRHFESTRKPAGAW